MVSGTLDRRYNQARGYGGVRASSSRQQQQEAYTRATMARNRIAARSARARGYEAGPKSVDPFTGAMVSRGRAEEALQRQQVFREEGSGVYGGGTLRREIPRAYSELSDLLPGL